jgi:hypothetical protein
MLYLDNSSYKPEDAIYLKNKARALISGHEIIIRDTRVSSRYIEYDISIPNGEDINDLANKLSDIGLFANYYEVAERHRDKPEAMAEAVVLFNEEKYWIAHEILESVWKVSQGDEKNLINGIILVSAAFVHDEKGEADISISILKRAMKKLEKANGIYYQICIDALKNRIRNILSSGKVERFRI